MPHVAVLTGDLIGSTSSDPSRLDRTMGVLRSCAEDIDDDTRFTRYRGDGWQMLLRNPGDCLWASLYIRARLAEDDALPTRISVGIGDADHLGTDGLAAASGSAFVASGEGLDDMPKDRTLTIAGDGVCAFQTVLFAFAEDYSHRWSREQAQAVALALGPDRPTQAEAAARLGVTRQAVGLRLKAAGFTLLQAAHQAFFTHYAERPGHG